MFTNTTKSVLRISREVEGQTHGLAEDRWKITCRKTRSNKRNNTRQIKIEAFICLVIYECLTPVSPIRIRRVERVKRCFAVMVVTSDSMTLSVVRAFVRVPFRSTIEETCGGQEKENIYFLNFLA